MMTPTVSAATAHICSTLYRFPHRYPTVNVVTLPKLRRMMCSGTEMWKANAQLLSMLTAKNMSAMQARRRSGIAVVRKGFHEIFCESVLSCEESAKRVARANCTKVMIRPVGAEGGAGQSGVHRRWKVRRGCGRALAQEGTLPLSGSYLSWSPLTMAGECGMREEKMGD